MNESNIIDEICADDSLEFDKDLTPSDIQTVKLIVEKFFDYNISELFGNGEREEAVRRLEAFLAFPAVSGTERLSADLKDLIDLIKRLRNYDYRYHHTQFDSDMENLMAYYQIFVIEAARA